MGVRGKECGTFDLAGTEMVGIVEGDTGLKFAVDSSFVEQDVGPIISPYGNGCVRLDDEMSEFYVVSGRMYQDDDDTVECVEVAPGEDPAMVFRNYMLASRSEDGLVPLEIPEDGPGSVVVASVRSLGDILSSRRRSWSV